MFYLVDDSIDESNSKSSTSVFMIERFTESYSDLSYMYMRYKHPFRSTVFSVMTRHPPDFPLFFEEIIILTLR